MFVDGSDVIYRIDNADHLRLDAGMGGRAVEEYGIGVVD